jgi:carbamoyl-phosphate synthase large subunit
MKNGEIHFVVNTVDASHSVRDSVSIRRTALLRDIPYFTTIDGARAAAGAIDALRQRPLTVRSLQEYLKR